MPRPALPALVLPALLTLAEPGWAPAQEPRAPLPKEVLVVVRNATTFLADEDLRPGLEALQIQVRRDFLPVWGVGANLVLQRTGCPAPTGAWWLVLVDASAVAGVLGYRDLTAEKQPLGIVAVPPQGPLQGAWTRVASRELLAMLVDPWLDRSVVLPAGTPDPVTHVAPYRVADVAVTDPVLGDTYLIHGQQVTDFTTPAYFDPRLRRDLTTPLDHLGRVTEPLQPRPGGRQKIWEFSTASRARVIPGPAPEGSARSLLREKQESGEPLLASEP